MQIRLLHSLHIVYAFATAELTATNHDSVVLALLVPVQGVSVALLVISLLSE